MASLFLKDLHSSDSEDDDYIPDGEAVSDEDDGKKPLPLDDEIETTKKRKSEKIRERLNTDLEKNKAFDKSPSTEVNVVEKQKANDLFKSFLDEVEADMKVKVPRVRTPEKDSTHNSPKVPSNSDIKSNESMLKQSFCELFKFAGETVVVPMRSVNEIISTSKSTDSVAEKSDSDKPTNQSPIVKRKGLDTVLGTIMNKKSKLTTLQKSSLDWSKYKSEQGISEELQNYNKGRGGFIERQRFLQRSYDRNYEIERDLRMSRHKKSC